MLRIFCELSCVKAVHHAPHVHLRGFAHGVKIKWLAEYCGTSVAMIEKHYGNYVGGDSEEQLNQLFGAKSETFEAEKPKAGRSSGNLTKTG